MWYLIVSTPDLCTITYFTYFLTIKLFVLSIFEWSFLTGLTVLYVLYRGSYTSAHVLLNSLNKLGKSDKMRLLPSILFLFRNEFDSNIQEHVSKNLSIIWH